MKLIDAGIDARINLADVEPEEDHRRQCRERVAPMDQEHDRNL